MSSESIDNKLSRLEGSLQQFEKRFDSLERRFDAFEKRFEDFQRYVNVRFDVLERKIDTNFRWNVGITLTSFFALASMMVSGFIAILSRLH